MPTCRDIDAQIVDLLYGELDSPVEASFREHLASCDACTNLLTSFAWVRDLMRELPLEEAPIAVSNIVLHEASKRAAATSASRDEEKPGLWAWLTGLWQPLIAHPAAAAAASLVLIATVGGVMYSRGGSQVAEPVILNSDKADSRERVAKTPDSPAPPVATPTGEISAPIRPGADGEQRNAWDRVEKDGYAVDLTTAKQQAELAATGTVSGLDNQRDGLSKRPEEAEKPAIGEKSEYRGSAKGKLSATRWDASKSSGRAVASKDAPAKGSVVAPRPVDEIRSADLGAELSPEGEDDDDSLPPTQVLDMSEGVGVAQGAGSAGGLFDETPAASSTVGTVRARSEAMPEAKKPSVVEKTLDKAEAQTREQNQKTAQKRSKRASRPVSKRAAPAPPPPVRATASRSNSIPVAGNTSAPPTDDRINDSKKKDARKSAWAEGKHAQLNRALASKRCDLAAVLANDIRDRDRKYYNANLLNAKSLAPCRTVIASETTRRSRERAAKAKRAAKKKARSDEKQAAEAAADAAE